MLLDKNKIFKKSIDLDVSHFTFDGMILLHEQFDDEGRKESYSAEKCFTCGSWTLTFVILKNIGNNNHPKEIRVGESCAEYFELPDNFSALALSQQRAEIAKAERDRQKKAIEKLYTTEPQLAQLGEFLSEIDYNFSYSFKKIKYDLTDEQIQELKNEALTLWGNIVNRTKEEERLSKRVQLQDGLQEVTGTVVNRYWKDMDVYAVEYVILEVNDNTLFVNATKAFEEIKMGDVVTIELDVTMFKENRETGKKEDTFKGMAKAGRRKIKNIVKASE